MMLLDRIVELLLEAQVAAGDDADQLLAVDHRHAGDVVRARESACTSRIEVCGPTVIGSRITPASNFLTRRTSAAWRSIVMFLWMMPMPPRLRHGDGEARFGDGVHRGGHDRDVQADGRGSGGCRVSTSRGSTFECAGTRETSSKVRASARMRMLESPAAKRELYAA